MTRPCGEPAGDEKTADGTAECTQPEKNQKAKGLVFRMNMGSSDGGAKRWK
jgi:hypothetical protein